MKPTIKILFLCISLGLLTGCHRCNEDDCYDGDSLRFRLLTSAGEDVMLRDNAGDILAHLEVEATGDKGQKYYAPVKAFPYGDAGVVLSCNIRVEINEWKLALDGAPLATFVVDFGSTTDLCCIDDFYIKTITLNGQQAEEPAEVIVD